VDLLEFFFTMTGQEFLAFYVVWFLTLYGARWVLRKGGADAPWITLVALALFEGVGLLRIIGGMHHDKHKWVILIVFMLIGAVLFLLRWASSGSNGTGGGGCGYAGGGCGGGGGSCGSASCGGGSSCGGGGGCGGCGGS